MITRWHRLALIAGLASTLTLSTVAGQVNENPVRSPTYPTSSPNPTPSDEAAASIAKAQACVQMHMTPERQTRRKQALEFLRAIHLAETEAATFVPLSRLTAIAAPPRFVVQLTVDADGYIVRVRDADDPCAFALFSDQSGAIYLASPLQ